MCSCGVDIGTCFLVSARQDDNNQIQIKSIRDSFLDMENDPSIKSMLTMSKINFIESEDKLYLIGDSSVTMANIFKREARRPLSRGVISPGEVEAERILYVLLDNILGKAKIPGEICYYSIPGNPTDRADIDIIYHAAIFSKILENLNYHPVSMNEASAIVYSNCSKEQFSGIGISFGAGMCNVALLYQTMIGMSFSITNCGDWLDQSAAKATGSLTASRIQSIKEKGLNLMNPIEGDPKTVREREALAIYYKSLILRVLEAIKKEFMEHNTVELPHAIPIVLSGGTSLAKGFKELFEAGFSTVKDKFPVPISEIRMATDPLNAVSQGLLVAAMNYNENQR